jgi:Sulfotransferase family
MLVFWKENLIFLAVPKTGTTALEGALAPKAAMVLRDPPQLKHAPVSLYRKVLQPFFDLAPDRAFETLAVVRDPIDWLGSWYRYRSRDHLVGQPNSTRNMSFDAFVTEYIQETPAGFADVGAQSKFLLTGEGKIGVTHLFRYEARPKLVRFLESRLSTDITLKRLNVSPPADVTLSPSTERALRATRPAEFDLWGQGIA